MGYIGQTITTVFPTSVSLDTVTATTSLKTPLVEFTDGDNAFTISDGGNVAFSGTVSGLPSGSEAFSARGTGGVWTAASNNDVLAFNNAANGDSFDTGSNYNTSTYKYTAPATGLYMFWYAIYTAEADTGNEFTFLLDSARVDFSGGSDDKFSSLNSSSDDHIQNATIVVPMTSGQTMAVIAATGSDYYMPHCSWGGCRLS